MEPFAALTSMLVPLPRSDISTDQIIPARFLKGTDKADMGDKLFIDWRYREDGALRSEFALNRPEMEGRRILLTGDNFGCGSSREHAIWALLGWGFRAVISTSFADIFRGNSLKNGLLPVVVDESTHRELVEGAERNAATEVTIDLATQKLIVATGRTIGFPIDAFSKQCLLQGIDQLGYLLNLTSKIEAYELTRPRQLGAATDRKGQAVMGLPTQRHEG